MKYKFMAVLFALPIVCLLIWTFSLTYKRYTAPEVRVQVTGYDPTDLLSGHYIQYSIDWNKTDCSQFAGNQCPDKQDFCHEARWGRQCRFYIPEARAQALDDLFRHRNQTDLVFEVIYSYQPGKTAIAKQLLINGQDWHDYLQEQELIE